MKVIRRFLIRATVSLAIVSRGCVPPPPPDVQPSPPPSSSGAGVVIGAPA